MKKIKTFSKVINFVMQHANRLILDDYIYLNVEKDGSSLLQLVQSLDQGDITGGVGITDNILVLGHKGYKTMSLWRFDTDRYTLLQRQKLVTYPSYINCRVWQMKRDPYADSPNQIYAVMGEICLYRVSLVAKDLS